MRLNYRTTANLLTYPQILSGPKPNHVSLGDLHGNALKLIYILMEEGVLKLDERQYEQLKNIYLTPTDELTRDQLTEFKKIISSAEVSNEQALTLIGDELADRGNNDYFTLLVFKKLHDAKLNFNITLSNHSAEFIRDYEREQFTGANILRAGQASSLPNMHCLIEKNLIDENEVRDIVQTCYKPRVKAITYTLSEKQEVTLFSHAPIGLETIERLAKKFELDYKDSTAKELIQTVDKINEKVEQLFSEKKLAELIDKEGYSSQTKPISVDRPLQRLVWNRKVGRELVTETTTGMRVKFVHGHIGDGPLIKADKVVATHQNLDTCWGKSPELFELDTYQDSVLHYTRQSNDYSALEVTDDLFDDLAIKLRAKEKFNSLLANFKIKADELTVKGMRLPEYKKAADKAHLLCNTLERAGKIFFTTKTTPESFKQFEFYIKQSFKSARGELEKNRSVWHGTNPFVSLCRGVLGVLSILLVGIPALAISLGTKQGFIATFFYKKTDSYEKLKTLQKGSKEVLNEFRNTILKENESEDESIAPAPK